VTVFDAAGEVVAGDEPAAGLSAGFERGKSVSAIAAEFIGGWILGLAYGADSNQRLPTVAAEALVVRVDTATIGAVHNAPLG
jgi:hypothetical protein